MKFSFSPALFAKQYPDLMAVHEIFSWLEKLCEALDVQYMAQESSLTNAKGFDMSADFRKCLFGMRSAAYLLNPHNQEGLEHLSKPRKTIGAIAIAGKLNVELIEATAEDMADLNGWNSVVQLTQFIEVLEVARGKIRDGVVAIEEEVPDKWWSFLDFVKVTILPAIDESIDKLNAICKKRSIIKNPSATKGKINVARKS